jgi:hypothetical protein
MSLLILILTFLSVTLAMHAFLTRPRREGVAAGAFVPVRFERSHSPSGLVALLFRS